jgi:hypothetical protein
MLAAGLLAAAPAHAQDEAQTDPTGGRHPVAPGNNWSITDSDCLIDAGWDGDIGIVVNRHLDHHDLGIYDPAFKNVVPEKVVTVRYGAAGRPAGKGEYEALGHRDGDLRSYVIEADMPLLDAFATTNSFQFYRGGVMEIELSMEGFSDALSAMQSCEAMLPSEPMDEPTPAEDDGDGSALEAAQAAAAAAQAAARP